MTNMVSALSQSMPGLGRIVVDRTGLSGTFDVDLTWAPDIAQAPALQGTSQPASSDGPSLTTALEEQLGLRLVRADGPVEIVVIDSVTLPTPN